MTRTALDLTPTERSKYRLLRILERQENKLGNEAVELRKEEAWEVAKEAAQLLRTKYGAKRIVAFGSLAHDKGFTLWSDIDLAAWGIAPDKFYSAVAAVTALSPSFKADLIDFEEATPTLKKIIEQDGILL